MAYEDFKGLTRRAASDKMLHDKAFNIAKNPKYDRYQRGPASMLYKSFHKKPSVMGARWESLATQNKLAGGAATNKNMSIKELAEELHKPISRTFSKRKVYSPFTDNTWGADLADVQLISKFNKGICFLLYSNWYFQ